MRIITNTPGVALPSMPQFLQAKCAHLTRYLSGDAMKYHPNLANVPTVAWNSVVFDGRICGIPAAYPLFVSVHWVHQELLDRDALQQPRNMDEYTQVPKHVTNPQRDMYRMSPAPMIGYGTSGPFPATYGLPNNWSVDANGRLTRVQEIPAYKDASIRRARSGGGHEFPEVAPVQHC